MLLDPLLRMVVDRVIPPPTLGDEARGCISRSDRVAGLGQGEIDCIGRNLMPSMILHARHAPVSGYEPGVPRCALHCSLFYQGDRY